MIRFAFVALSALTLAACASGSSEKVSLPPAPRAGEPPGIAGLDADDMRANFGKPAFVRTEGKAQLWRYDSANCKGFFFLYPEGATMRVHHVETVPRGSGPTGADPVCLTVLLKTRAARPVS